MFIKKSSIDELASNLELNMKRTYASTKYTETVESVVNNLVIAANILDEMGFEKEANDLTMLLDTKNAWHVPPQHSPTSEQMMSNLKDHGTVLEAPKADLVPSAKGNHLAKSDSNDATAIEVTDDDKVDDKDDAASNENESKDKNEAKDGEVLEVEDPEKEDWHHKDDSKRSR